MGSNLGTLRPDPQLTRHINDLYPRLDQIEQAAEAVGALVDSRGWAVVLELVDAEIATIDRDLDSSVVLESRAHYAAKHGRRGGLLAVREAANALLVRAESRMQEERRRHEGVAGSAPGGG